MKIGMIGMGFVGGNTAKVLEMAHEILPYDKFKEPYTDPSVLRGSEVVFLSVPTPMQPSGAIDYTPIHQSLETLTKVTNENKRPLVVVRSTAVSGTTDALAEQFPFRFAFNPEFLKERTALEDMQNTDRIVIGANNQEDYELVKSVYEPIFPNAKYFHVDRKTAEMIKYAANVTLAGQIALANEIYGICKATGVDYNTVKEITAEDQRIGSNRDVPGFDGDFGFGGKCFPKDLNALIYHARTHQYRPYLLEEIWRLNEKVRKNKDWLDIPGATSANQEFTKK